MKVQLQTNYSGTNLIQNQNRTKTSNKTNFGSTILVSAKPYANPKGFDLMDSLVRMFKRFDPTAILPEEHSVRVSFPDGDYKDMLEHLYGFLHERHGWSIYRAKDMHSLSTDALSKAKLDVPEFKVNP